MYDNEKYSSLRDAGFQIFYMFINVGAIFAPFIAIGVRNWWLKVNHFDYDATLPELCHKYLEQGQNMIPQELEKLTTLANTVSLDGTQVTDMTAFCQQLSGRVQPRIPLCIHGRYRCHAGFSGHFTLPIRANSPIRERRLWKLLLQRL